MRRLLALSGVGAAGFVALAALVMFLLRPDLDDPADIGPAAGPRPEVGLMSGLPLYRTLDAGIAEMARGEDEMPWARRVLESRYRLVPLDTLSPIPSLVPDDPDTDPLSGLDRIAIIQPRGISPADNVALDDWVRGGGRLLLALDPMLTGDYDLPLGDPRRPNTTALIPPVVARWGLEMVFDGTQLATVRSESYPGGMLPLALAGELRALADENGSCRFEASGALARCAIGSGQVVLLADAAVFEHRALASGAEKGGSALAELFDYAFGCGVTGDNAGKLAPCAPSTGANRGE